MKSLKLLKELYTFCEAAALAFDEHKINLARQEKVLNDKLDEVRHQHDAINQV